MTMAIAVASAGRGVSEELIGILDRRSEVAA
jgi:hypothetical protein